MELHIGEALKLFTPREIKIKTRGQWIREFYKELSKSYNEVSPRPLTKKYLGIRMKNRVPDAELPVLWKLCKESKNFSSFFWWRLKRYPYIKEEKEKKEERPKQISLL